MAESAIVDAIARRFRARGAWVIKIHGSTMQARGTPDLLVCYRGRFLGIEVKVPGKEPTAIQSHVLSEISAAGGLVTTAHSVEEALLLVEKCEAEGWS